MAKSINKYSMEIQHAINLRKNNFFKSAHRILLDIARCQKINQLFTLINCFE
jgi:hypothetical protein